MADLSYLTRENGSPDRRPNVYLAIHPDDMPACFSQVCQELLAASDCAVYYYDSPSVDTDEDFFLQLKQMRVLVVPVTENLLSGQCRALEIEIPFARANHIPILPLIRQSGVETEFNALCNDLHCLHSYESHPNFVTYPEKLKSYLNSVFLGDEEEKRIRQHFSSRIFLSYRRQDRCYAEKVMRTIHQCPQYRDVAIWYDEFLTPGENFNDTIRTQILQSDLFALVVTPNVITDDNYIIRHEYPEAIKQHKPIVTVESVCTDNALLQQKLPQAPACVKLADTDTLYRTLSAHLPLSPAAQNSGEHDYYIGLAYLYGIMAETDPVKAVELITQAAQTGYQTALSKLTDMYMTGNGVQRDLTQALDWCKQYVKCLEQDYQNNPDSVPISLAYAQEKLGDIYRQMGMQQQALDATEAYVRAMYRIACSEGTPGTYRFLAEACNQLGNLHRTFGNMDRAYNCFRQGLRLTQQIADQLKSSASLRSHANSCDAFGQMLCFDGKLREAKEMFSTALQLRQKANAHRPDDDDTLSALSISYGNLARICNALGEADEGIEFAQKSLQIDEKMHQRHQDPQSQQSLLISSLDLGNSFIQKKDWAQAGKYLEQANQLALQLQKQAGSLDNARYLALTWISLGDLYDHQQQYDSALGYYTKACETLQDLADNCSNSEILRELASAYMHCGRIVYFQNDILAATLHYEKARKILQQLESGSMKGHLRELAYVYTRLGDFYFQLGIHCQRDNDDKTAFTHFDTAAKMFRLADSQDTDTHRKLAAAHEYMGSICLQAGATDEAQHHLEESLAVRQAISYAQPEDRFHELSVSYFLLGKVYAHKDDFKMSRQFLEDALECVTELPDSIGTYHQLHEGLQLLTHVCIQGGMEQAAVGYAKQTVPISYQLLKQEPTEDNLYHFGTANMTAGMLTAEAKYLQRAYDIFSDLISMEPQNRTYQRLLKTAQQALRQLQ